jgi:hypothetical protein
MSTLEVVANISSISRSSNEGWVNKCTVPVNILPPEMEGAMYIGENPRQGVTG